MKIFRLQVGTLGTNTYLLRDAEGQDGLVVDPGGDAPRIVSRCREERINPLYLVNTHAHADHIAGNRALKEAFPRAELCIGALEADRLRDPVANLGPAFGMAPDSPPADRRLQDGDVLRFGASELEVLLTPGHSPGAISLLARAQDPPLLFCGDLMFRRGVGRIDLPGGDRQTLLDSIRNRVFTLPPETVLWPGHGEETTVEEERRLNPFLPAS